MEGLREQVEGLQVRHGWEGPAHAPPGAPRWLDLPTSTADMPPPPLARRLHGAQADPPTARRPPPRLL